MDTTSRPAKIINCHTESAQRGCGTGQDVTNMKFGRKVIPVEHPCLFVFVILTRLFRSLRTSSVVCTPFLEIKDCTRRNERRWTGGAVLLRVMKRKRELTTAPHGT